MGVVDCKGVSQDPKTKDYLIVMNYFENGNLRQFLQNNYNQLNFQGKIKLLNIIAQGLNSIHMEGLMHCDLHAGNILSGDYTSCHIADLGLCRPVNETNQGNVYGVMPYMAPEVLRGKKYTQKADIYSFGMIAYEILTGLPPYYDREHDINLSLAICNGQRPEFQIKIPQLLEDLIKRC
jgi:serine/threonine protein kinase